MSSLAESPEYQALRRYADLTIEKRELKARLDELSATLKAMEPALLAYLTAAGVKSITIPGFTIFTQRDPWIRPMTGVTRLQVCEALKIAGLGRMVKENYSTESLTSYLRQLEQRSKLIADPDQEERTPDEQLRDLLHPAVASLVQVKSQFALRIRKKDDQYAESQYAEERTANEGDEDDEF